MGCQATHGLSHNIHAQLLLLLLPTLASYSPAHCPTQADTGRAARWRMRSSSSRGSAASWTQPSRAALALEPCMCGRREQRSGLPGVQAWHAATGAACKERTLELYWPPSN